MCRTTLEGVIVNVSEHNHARPETQKLIRDTVHVNIKQKAGETPNERPTTLILSSIKGIEPAFEIRHLNNYRRLVNRVKLSTRPPLPVDSDDVFLKLAAEDFPDMKLSRRMDGNNIVMFYDSQLLHFINEFPLLADGTFKTCPKFFYQLYTFHVLKDGFSFPIVYFILKDKKIKTYKRILSLLKEECLNYDININLNYICIDFEKAMISALKAVFPDIQIIGCRFHLGQTWFRSIQRLKLLNMYKEKSEQGKWLRRLFGFPYLEKEKVKTYFEAYIIDAPIECHELVRYLEKNFIKDSAPFPPNLWAGVCDNIVTTNNSVESWHRHFSETFTSSKPNIYKLIENLELTNSLSLVKSNSTGGKIVNDNTEIKEKCKQLDEGEIDLFEFLTFCSAKNRPVF